MTRAKRPRGRPPKVFVLGQNENGESVPVTYKSSGLSRKDVWRGRQFAAIPKDVFEKFLADHPTRAGILRLAARYSGAATDEGRIKIRTDDAARAAWSIASHSTEGFVEELVAFLCEYLRAARSSQGAA